jgi:short-subunit dehydrogenase
MLSYSWRMECEPFGVNICCVCPGDVKTEFTKNRVKNFATNERYGSRIKTATEKFDSKQDKRMEPITVAKKIFKYSLKRKPKPMIIIGAKYKLFYFASKLLPLRALMFILKKMYDGK